MADFLILKQKTKKIYLCLGKMKTEDKKNVKIEGGYILLIQCHFESSLRPSLVATIF